MGTTLTAAALVNEDGQRRHALVNVGDSRSYRFHDGELTQITVDHSLAEEMVRSGELSDVRGGRAPPPPHPDPGPRRGRRRGRRPVADPAGPGRPVPAVQRRPDQRARRPARSAEVLASVPRSPAWRPTCWSGRPGPTGAATTSRWWWSTWWWARRRVDSAPAVAAVAADFGPFPRCPDTGGATDGRRTSVLPGPGRSGRAPRPAGGRRRARPGTAGRPRPPADHLPDPAVRGAAGRRAGRRLLRGPLVRHQLVLRAGQQQRAGHLPGPDRRRFALYNPVEVERTGVTTADVPAVPSPNSRAGVAGGLGGQRRAAYVANLVATQHVSRSAPRTRPRPAARLPTTIPAVDAPRPRERPDGTAHPPPRRSSWCCASSPCSSSSTTSRC